MSQAGTIPAHLYPLYCDYIHDMNRSARLQGGKSADLSILSQPDFLAVWNALPESRRAFWQRRFETGHEEVAKLERRKLVAAFTTSNLNHAEPKAARAA